MAINKTNVKTEYDLQRYLQENAAKSERLYHYTTYESIIRIIKNKCFRLTRMDLLNDKAEQKLGNQNEHFKNYILSFTRDKEYISMWAMYGKASGIKLRLDLPTILFKKVIDNNFYFDDKKENKIHLHNNNYLDRFSKMDFLISDIVYIDKKSTLRHNESNFNNFIEKLSVNNDMPGFIKYDAWEFEREKRLRVLIYENIDKLNRNEPIPPYIYAGIDSNLIHNFHITFNPWMSSEIKTEIKKSLNGLAGYELQYSDSQHDGEVTEL